MSLRLNGQVEPRPLPGGAIARAGVVGSSAFVCLGWHAATHHRGWDLTSTLARDALDAIALGLTFATGERKDRLIANGGVVAANFAAIMIKRLRPDERPDRSNRKSMPTEHSARAFAIATAVAKCHGWRLGLPALLDATSSVMGASELGSIIGTTLPQSRARNGNRTRRRQAGTRVGI